MDDLEPDRASGALPCVTNGICCPGCGRRFTPTHWRQKHCRPSCRVLALRARREHAADLFSDATTEREDGEGGIANGGPRRDLDPYQIP